MPIVSRYQLTAWYAVVTTTMRLRLDSHSTATRPRYDHSTTYVTTVGLPVCGLLHSGLNR